METIVNTSYKAPARSRISMRMVVFAGMVAVLLGYPVWVYLDEALSGGIKDRGDYLEVNLKAMSTFPFDGYSGRLEDVPKRWRDLDGKKIEVVGEMWQPYSAGNRIKGFELVYSIAQCCFQGPPQIQHFVQSRVVDGKAVGFYSGPVRVRGTLQVKITRDETGKINGVYHLDVESVRPA